MSKVLDTKENMMKCICGTCPTFKQSPLSGVFFCVKGKAEEKVKQVGCVCGGCPIYAEFKLKGGYFCLK